MKNRIQSISFSGVQTIFVFYFVSFCAILYRLNSYTHTDYNSVSTTEVYLFRWLPTDLNLNPLLSFIGPALMITFLFLLLAITYQWARILWFVLFFFVEGFIFSYTLGHQIHMYLWMNLFFAIIPWPLNTNTDAKLLRPYIRAAQLQIFVIYGLAGVWKILAVIESFQNREIAAGFDYVPYAIAWEFINSNRAYEASLWIFDHPLICFALATTVLLAQCGSILIAFFPRFYFMWGLLLAIFHVGTLISVNVFFKWSIPPILLFLCFYTPDE